MTFDIKDCSRDHQRQDWHAEHKGNCASLKQKHLNIQLHNAIREAPSLISSESTDHIDKINNLLKEGAQIYSRIECASPVDLAIVGEHPDILILLIQHGANVDGDPSRTGHVIIFLVLLFSFITAIPFSTFSGFFA